LVFAFGLAFAGIFAAIYLYLNHQSAPSTAAAAPQNSATTIPPATNPPAENTSKSLAFRLVTENKQSMARFVVVKPLRR